MKIFYNPKFDISGGSPLIISDKVIEFPCPAIPCLEMSERGDFTLGRLIFFTPIKANLYFL